MATTGLYLLLLPAFFLLINGQCSDDDLYIKLTKCSQTANDVENSLSCKGTEIGHKIKEVFDCFSDCKGQVPPFYMRQFNETKRKLEDSVSSRCYQNQKGPAEARDGGPASACGFTEGLACVGGIGGLLNLPQQFGLGNLPGICGGISGLAGFIGDCGDLISSCLETFNVLGDANSIKYGINMGKELTQGGCECAGQINNAVEAYTGLPKNRQAAQMACPIIQATTQTVRGVMDGCVNRLTKASGVKTLDWLDMTITAIDIANPIVGGVCGTVNILTGSAAPATISLSVFLAMATIVFHLMRRR